MFNVTKRSLFLAAGGFIILALLGVAGFSLWPREQPMSQVKTPPPPPSQIQHQPISSPTSTPTLQPSPDQMATWKTYHNKKFGFEVKYPPALHLSDRSSDGFLELLIPGATMDVDKGATYPVSFNILIDSVSANQVDTILSDRLLKEKIGEEKIGNYTWSKYDSGGMVPWEIYSLYKDGTLIQFGIPKVKVIGYEGVFREMISTLKFIPESKAPY